MNLASRVEGILFYTSEPMSVRTLAHIFETEETAIEEALSLLATTLTGRGITLVREGHLVELMTAPGLREVIEKIKKEELRRDIGKAGSETLAIIAYHEYVTRAEIDFIRGVNSGFILRNLIRGLIERITNPHDQRSFAYKPTIELYAHLGITRKEELPEYEEMIAAIAKYRNTEAPSEETV